MTRRSRIRRRRSVEAVFADLLSRWYAQSLRRPLRLAHRAKHTSLEHYDTNHHMISQDTLTFWERGTS